MTKTLTEEMYTPEQAKLQYVETQIDEMQAIIRRNEVDIYINKDIEWNEAEQDGVDTQIKTLEKENAKLSKAVASLKKLQAELDKQYNNNSDGNTRRL